MRVIIGIPILVYLFFCSYVYCGKISRADTEENDDKIEQALELLTARGLKTDDQQLTGDHERRTASADSEAKHGVVSIYVEKTQFICGGSIIDKRSVLTAAHCIKHLSNEVLVTVRAGDRMMRIKDEHEQHVRVKKRIIHNRYKKKAIKFDLAILKLGEDFEFNDYVQPMAIPKPWKERFLLEDGNCMLVGFGVLDYNDVDYPWVLQESDPYLRTGWYCKNYLAEMNVLDVLSFDPDYQLCTRKEKFGTCPGDSGGPLVCYDSNDAPYLVGVVSWGSLNCWDVFNVYTRVTPFTSWIEKNME